MCKLTIALHLPSSSLLLFTVSFSVATHLPKWVTWTAPLGLCLDHSVHLVSLLWPPQSSSAGPQDVEGRAAAAAAAARCLDASESSSSNLFFEPLKASPERVMELRGKWTSDPNCHPSSSKHWTQSLLTPTFTQRRHTTQASALQWSLCMQPWERGVFWCLCGMSLLVKVDNVIMVLGGIVQKPHGTTHSARCWGARLYCK